MSGVQGVGGASSTPGVGGRAAAGRADAARSVQGVSPAGEPGVEAVAAFDPIAAVVQIARDASAPPPAGLQERLLDWAAPTTRQFEAVSPARLLPLLGLAVDRLADEAQHGDELVRLGAVALERELRDHQDLAERRATLIEP